MKKRVYGTSLLLLDEFTSSVDSATERRMMNIIMQEFAEDTVIMVSHRLDVVTELFDRVILMHSGEVKEIGNPRTLASQPESLYAQLLASAKGGE